MKNKSLLKRIGASLAAAGLLSGVALTSGAALVSAAGIGPIYPTLEMAIAIDQDTGNVVVLNGQTLEITTSANISSGDPVWEDNPEEFSAEEFGAPTPDAGLTVVSTTHTWSASRTSGAGAPCSRNSGSGQTFSIATLACKADIDYLQYYKVITVTNTSGSTKTLRLTQ